MYTSTSFDNHVPTLVTHRMPRSGKLPVLNLLIGPKNQVFRPAGATRCTDSCWTWQDQRAVGSTWLCKISCQSPPGCGFGPKRSKMSSFRLRVAPLGRLPSPMSKFFRAFYTPSHPTLLFQNPCDSHHRLRSYCWETARPSIRPNFSVPL